MPKILQYSNIPVTNVLPVRLLQTHERLLQVPNVWEQFVDDIFNLFLNMQTCKTLFITSTIFIKILSLLWRRKAMEN